MRHGLSASLILHHCATVELPNRSSEVWSPESKKKFKKIIRHPLVRFKPYLGLAVIVPLPLRPWYFKSVVMYARHWFRYVARVGVGAALLRLLRTCQAVLL